MLSQVRPAAAMSVPKSVFKQSQNPRDEVLHQREASRDVVGLHEVVGGVGVKVLGGEEAGADRGVLAARRSAAAFTAWWPSLGQPRSRATAVTAWTAACQSPSEPAALSPAAKWASADCNASSAARACSRGVWGTTCP